MALPIIKTKKDSPEIIIIMATTMEAFAEIVLKVVEVPCCELRRFRLRSHRFNVRYPESRLSRFTKYVVVYSTSVSILATGSPSETKWTLVQAGCLE